MSAEILILWTAASVITGALLGALFGMEGVMSTDEKITKLKAERAELVEALMVIKESCIDGGVCEGPYGDVWIYDENNHKELLHDYCSRYIMSKIANAHATFVAAIKHEKPHEIHVSGATSADFRERSTHIANTVEALRTYLKAVIHDTRDNATVFMEEAIEVMADLDILASDASDLFARAADRVDEEREAA